jgi:polar amino acid transport system substrate-binding protein
MLKYISIIAMPVILAAGILAAGCSQSSTPDSSTTYGQYAQQGQTAFAGNCAGCHGASGQGRTAPTLIGAGASLEKYDNAQGLFGYVSTNMPALNPGSLSNQEYLEILSYLLVENNYISAETPFDETRLGNISLE